MRAEIISVGSELTSGAMLDTNSQWLSQELIQRGISVAFHTTVGDSRDDHLDVLRNAIRRADLVIMTGGLGPTKDDLAREILAELADVSLVLDQNSLDAIQQLYTSRNRTMPEINAVQAYFPKGSTPLKNPIGTAPGVWMEFDSSNPNNSESTTQNSRTVLASLPGVPSEMKKMFTEQVVPKLPQSHLIIRHHLIRCFGIGESQAEELLGDITTRGRDPEVGITVSDATITLRITAVGEDEKTCGEKIESTKQTIQARLGEFIFGKEDDELHHKVSEFLQQQSQTVSAVELGITGGLASLLAQNEMSSHFSGGISFPTWKATHTHWDVSFDTAQNQCEAKPQEEVQEVNTQNDVGQLAERCREKFQTDYALATYITSPSDADGTAHISLATPEAVFSQSLSFISTQNLQNARTVKTALNMLRLHLQKYKKDD